MTEFSLFVKWTLAHDSNYQSLLSKLLAQENKCIAGATNQSAKQHCQKDRILYESYLSRTTKEFAQQAEKICTEIIQKKNATSTESIDKCLEECINFSMLSLENLRNSTVCRLDSLVNKYDFDKL